ncbi:MAG TPA: phospholipase [Cyanobacteria bacterium UBA11149]|nr:phospholipase [Cyanobacteria bacterium UBA11366]HBK66909.1 phospholipase [Cyanobacteria bacterium UBA11166]HBR73691.1 phospholipase [Cyanobacteria bacterium UBA11159]HBS72538.1 phospholipase [Cyanobacteria bacterium UBA11153]HBW87312.1 phospholipase [Cyanobacteria bacterium UBA11149]HCA96460.1 phospholipase [Cyanobacteria bacterium UBA9226]
MSFPVLQLFLALVGIFAIAYFFIGVLLLVCQNRLLFFPSREIQTMPGDVGLVYEDVWLSVSNEVGKEERLHGWWIPGAFARDNFLLYLHGNGENIGANVHHAKRFQELGFSVFLIDYRGYGQSEGRFPVEKRVYQDAEVAWNYLVRERGIRVKDIFIYGHSLGGAIAIDLASRHPDMAGAIVQSSFTSIWDMLDFQPIYYRLFPKRLFIHQRFDSISKVKSLRMPILLIHGICDRTVPATMSQALFDGITAPKELWLVPDAAHNNVASVSGWQYQDKIKEFLARVRGE